MDEIISRIKEFRPCRAGREFLSTVTSIDDGLSRASLAHLEWLHYCVCKAGDYTAYSDAAWDEYMKATLPFRNARDGAILGCEDLLGEAERDRAVDAVWAHYYEQALPLYRAYEDCLKEYLREKLKEWANGVPSV